MIVFLRVIIKSERREKNTDIMGRKLDLVHQFCSKDIAFISLQKIFNYYFLCLLKLFHVTGQQLSPSDSLHCFVIISLHTQSQEDLEEIYIFVPLIHCSLKRKYLLALVKNMQIYCSVSLDLVVLETNIKSPKVSKYIKF